MLGNQKRLIIYFLIAVILIFIVFNSIFFRIYSANIEQIVMDENQSSIEKTSEFADIILESLEYTADIVQSNILIQQRLEAGSEEPAERYYDEVEIFNTLQSIATNTVKSVSSIDLFLNGSGKLITSDYGVFSNLSFEEGDFFRRLQENTAKFTITGGYRKELDFILDRNYEQVTFIRPFYILSSGMEAGTIAINIDKYNLKNLITRNTVSSSIVMDDKMNDIVSVFAGVHRSLPGRLGGLKASMKESRGSMVFEMDGQKQILVYCTSPYTGWRFATVVPAGASFKQMHVLRDYILLLFLLMSAISVLILVILMTKNVYSKLKKLIAGMKEVERGNFDVTIPGSDRDEFGYMYESFNNMAGRIKSLFGELYQQKLLQKDAELKLLQSKINPHFIYNIFDNMNWLIQLERYNELEALVDAVSEYYKRSLNAGHDFISVADTVRQLESYVDIQRIRFRNRFTCSFSFDDCIQEMPVLNFMLQPLLENAICHGIEPKAGTSTILVKGYRKEDKVVFTVEDDGMGIAPDKLANINRCLEDGRTEEDNYFALANINKRIKLFYGEAYGLRITSQESSGTTVTVTIPSGYPAGKMSGEELQAVAVLPGDRQPGMTLPGEQPEMEV